MKAKSSLAVLMLMTMLLNCVVAVAAPHQETLRIVSIGPFDKGVAGQILELRVEGINTRMTEPPAADEMQIQISQGATTRNVSVRTASPVMIREAREGGGGGAAGAGGAAAGVDASELKMYQGLTFVVPHGLQVGEAEVSVTYRGRRSDAFKLSILERPLRPIVGGVPITTIAPTSIPTPARKGLPLGNPGLRFERGTKAELHVRPLPDPEDVGAGVLVRFKQGGAFYEANARVVHSERKTEQMVGGVRFLPSRDRLEIDVPETLAPSEAEIEVRLRAGGQTGEAATLPVLITDATRVIESPRETAPRLMAVTPRRVGAGQAVMISVDHRRTLDPDPSKTVIVVEQDNLRYTLQPEMNSVQRKPDTAPDEPVLLIARLDRRITGTAQLRVLNPARGEQGLSSEPTTIEIADELLAPEIAGVAESTHAELAPLRQMYEIQQKAGREFPQYDPASRYVTIRVNGLDYNPRFSRIRMEQEGRPAVTLSFNDFSLFSGNTLVVRVPRSLGAGTTRVTVENRGERGFSAPAVGTFELSRRE
jgi:hypothetical protein